MDAQWIKSLASRDNLLQIDIPHIPILLEDISTYISLPNFETDYVKTVQTIGKLKLDMEKKATTIWSVNSEKKISFPIILNNLPVTDICFPNPHNECNTIWDYKVSKIFGTLEQKDTEIKLVVDRVLEVKDVIGSCRILEVLSKLARREYRQYCNTEIDETIETCWNQMSKHPSFNTVKHY